MKNCFLAILFSILSVVAVNAANVKGQVFDEKGNGFLAMRYLAWKAPEEATPEDYRIDMRRWYTQADGGERVDKGFGFMTEQGPHNLARILLEDGFGHTLEVLNAIKDREDFRPSLNRVLSKDDPNYDHTIDMDKLYVPGDELFEY